MEGTLLPERDATTDGSNPDTDGDGLPDGLEFTLGSNPSNPDSDGDLLLDGSEFYVFHTSPFLPDSDFDGDTETVTSVSCLQGFLPEKCLAHVRI